MNRLGTLWLLTTAAMLAVTHPCPAADPEAAPPQEIPLRIAIPEQAQPILPLRDVRIGQRGYGLTVFHGTKIEPFPVEVVSVMSDFEPKRGAIWIRCDDPRLNISGPVQGMSGSPIYLWDENEAQTPGSGGKLIGAFAFGFSLTKICLAGVQPIELMREAAGRAHAGEGKQAVGMGGPPVAQTMATLQEMAAQRKLPASQTWQLDAMAKLCAQLPGAGRSASSTMPPPPAEGVMAGGRVTPMMLPLAVGSAEQASWLAPLLAPLGVSAIAAPGGMATLSGSPPKGLDVDAVRIEPGSVLVVPLGFGDLDLAASGTVTDVLPDGRVLGFGHAMFGQGDVAVPMATGYVHTVVPLITTSFKLAGSLQMAGALVRDENSAVIGMRNGSFSTAPVTVRVNFAGQEQREYHYQIVNHRMLTPMLAAICTAQSLVAQQQLPMEHTLQISGQVVFKGGRRFEIKSMAAAAGAEAVMFQLMPPTMAMMQNPFEPVELERVDMTVNVDPSVKMVTLIDGRIDRVEVAPGDRVGINVRLQPYGAPMTSRRIEIVIPQDMRDGDYELVVTDAGNYTGRTMASRPHRMVVRNLDDLQQAIQQTLAVEADVLYTLLQMPEQGLAYGRTELPQLPSSRRAMVQTPTTTSVTPYTVYHEVKTPVGAVVTGEVSFTINVRRPFMAPAPGMAPGNAPGMAPGQPGAPAAAGQ